MTPSSEKVLQDGLALPPEERERVAQHLLRSLDDADVSPEWAAEIARRVKEIEDGTAELVPAEDVFASIRAKLREMRKGK